jgi:hypothetical protein
MDAAGKLAVVRATARNGHTIEIAVAEPAGEEAAQAKAEGPKGTETKVPRAESGLQVGLAQFNLPGGIGRQQLALLLAQALVIALVFPGAYNVEFHKKCFLSVKQLTLKTL